MSTTTKNVGRVSIVPKGDWNINNTYIRLDLVTYNGNSYIAKKDVPKNIQLSNNNYWMLMASKGGQGEQGKQGAPFAIMKSYASIAAMNADFSNTDVQNGQFVIIDTGNVQDPDNAKLYYKGSNNYVFVTDMSGAAGIQGPRGTSAYEQAVAGGYEGTEAQFNEDLADFKELSEQAASSATAADNSAKDAEAYAIGKRSGTDVESTDPTYHNNAKYYSEQAALIVDDIEQVTTATTVGPADIATFNASAAGMPLKELTVDIEPVQDFNGYSRPWLGGAGKNQLSLSMSFLYEKNTNGTWTNNSYVSNGVTFIVQLNNNNDVIGIKVNGTASANTDFVFITRAPIPEYPMIENGCPSGGSNSTYGITTRIYYSDFDFIDYYDYGSGLGLSNMDGHSESFSSSIRIFSGYTASNLIFRPMIRFQFNEDETFEPYSNICPITGWTGCNVTRTGKNLLNRDAYTTGKTLDDTGNIIDAGASASVSEHIPVVAGAQYTFSCIPGSTGYKRVSAYTKDGAFIAPLLVKITGITVGEFRSKTFTIPSNAAYLIVSNNTPDTNVQLELGSVATDYEPFGTNIPITFPTSAGTVYGGTLDVVNKKLIVTKKYALLNDPNKWSETGINGFQYSDQFSDRKRYQTFLQGFLCSCANTSSNRGLRAQWISNTDYFGFSSFLYSNDNILDKIKTAAADNKIAILYDLAEPLVYDITTEQVATLLGENNIWANIGDVTVTYGAYLETIKTYADQAVDSAAAAGDAQGAAEDAQEAAEAVLASIPSDYTELSEDVSDLKSALTTQNDVSVNWTVGSIDSATGASIANTTRIRSLGYINKRGKSLTIDVPDGLRCSIRYYSAESESEYVKSNVNPLPTVWNTGTIVLDTTQPDYVRIVVSYTNDGQISADVGNNVDISTVGVIGAEDIKNEFSTFSERLKNANLSLSGNYFDKNHAEMLAGFIMKNGNVDSSAGYHHAFVELQGAGSYVRLIRYGTFGVHATNVQLFDKNKQFLKSIVGTRIDTTNLISFALSEDDASSAVYTVLNVADQYPDVMGLFFNSENYDFIGTRPPNANFGSLTNPLYKKKLIVDGDSICQGAYDLPYSGEGWFGRLKNDFSMTGNNYAVGGGTITDMTDTTVGGNPRHSVVVSIDTIIAENPQLDYLLLEGGTNDADLIGRFVGDTAPARFGSWAENDYTGSYDATTFCGAVEKTFYKALNQWPKAKIGFIIPMQMGRNNDTSANRRRYFDEIVSIAKKWHIPVLDLWNESQLDSRLTAYYDSTLTSAQNVSAGKCYYDGQHPTSYGYDLMQPTIESWLKNGLGSGNYGEVSPAEFNTLSEDVDNLKSAVIRYPKIWNAITDGGCDNTNTQDCSSIIQNAFNSASDGTVFYFPAGRYKISNALTLTGKNDIKIVGDGDSWNYGSRFYSEYGYTMLVIYGGNKLEISDILFYGNDISTSTAIGFEDNTPTTMECRVGNTKIHDISIVGFKNGIRVNAPTGYMNFYRVHISRIVAGGQGIAIGELYKNTGTTELGYTIIPNNIFIDNCTIDDLTNGAGTAGIRLCVGHYIFIRNCDICNFTGTNGYGILVTNSDSANRRLSDISILGNSLYNNRVGALIQSVASPSIKRINITANSIVGRIAEGQSAEYGVRAIISQNTPKIENLTVLGNTFNHSNSGFTNFAYSGAIDAVELYSAGVGI